MLGQQLTKEEVEDFMREADVVSEIKLFPKLHKTVRGRSGWILKKSAKIRCKRNPMKDYVDRSNLRFVGRQRET